MLDRASTFADFEMVELLTTKFVPLAIDQAYQRRQQDTEGDFYRKIASQGPRSDFRNTTQGFYVAAPDGRLLLYNNNRNPAKVKRLVQEALREFQSSGGSEPANVTPLFSGRVDSRYNPEPAEGSLVVRVRAKVLGGYQPTDDPWRKIFHSALSRDNLWISPEEHQSLVKGDLPRSLQERIARFHLVDNTRGEPPMWSEKEIRALQLELTGGRLSGHVHLETENGQRGYQAELLGFVEARGDQVVRLDLVAKGEFWGEGRYTRGAPTGKFPLAIALTLADGSDVADRIPPQGSRGWLQGYLR